MEIEVKFSVKSGSITHVNGCSEIGPLAAKFAALICPDMYPNKNNEAKSVLADILGYGPGESFLVGHEAHRAINEKRPATREYLKERAKYFNRVFEQFKEQYKPPMPLQDGDYVVTELGVFQQD